MVVSRPEVVVHPGNTSHTKQAFTACGKLTPIEFISGSLPMQLIHIRLQIKI
jgi:hypothetical protein